MKREINLENYRTDLIRGRLAELNLDVDSAAELAKLNKNTISKIRNGKDVKVSTLSQLATAIDLTLPQIFTPKEESALAK